MTNKGVPKMSAQRNRYVSLSLLATVVVLASLPAHWAAAAQEADTLEEVVVTGVRASEQRSVELKRNADVIQDSISAEDIGKLPDTTIADSLQRITGVQINREGGEGTSVNIRGLPQVGTLLNGEAFLTTGSIVSVQPDFGDIPSQLFAGADVNKSATASLLNAGITGTINLRTRRPFELQQGWTLAEPPVYHDGGVSGSLASRPQLDQLRAACLADEVDVQSAQRFNTRENTSNPPQLILQPFSREIHITDDDVILVC